MFNTRVQLSLYVPKPHAESVEHARRLLDPVQASLIPAHVTLCREDELQGLDLSTLESAISSSGLGPLGLKFGAPEVFQGHGVLLPCIEAEEDFHELRCCVLGNRNIKLHAPHITIAHPRNPRAPQNAPASLRAIPTNLVITFTSVRHIIQVAAAPWQLVAEQLLFGATRGDA